MKRPFLVAPLLLAACGGGELSLFITSDDLGDNSLSLTAPADLTTVRQLNVTVDEVWVHVSGDDIPDVVKGEDVEAASDGWHLLTTEDRPLDLMTVRGGAAWPLGNFPLPTGKLTQVRLKLKAFVAPAAERASLPGSVVEQDGTTCDLSIPTSAVEPGLKLSGLLPAMRIEAGGRYRALVNLKIKDSTKLDGAACAYKLDPVLKVRWSSVGGGGSK